MTETLTGKTTRSILFRDFTTETMMVRRPAGTTVYVTEHRRGKFIARIPHTLFEAHVSLIDVEPF
jgi:hypothetical protein